MVEYRTFVLASELPATSKVEGVELDRGRMVPPCKCAPSDSIIRVGICCIAGLSVVAVLLVADFELPHQVPFMVKKHFHRMRTGADAAHTVRRPPHRHSLTAHTIGEGWYSAIDTAKCLDDRWIYFIGDSNSLKITESWRGGLHRQQFQKEAYVASEGEYQRFKMGDIAWWQDSDVFYTYDEAIGNSRSNINITTSRQHKFRFSFRFQQQKNFSDVKRKVSTHLLEPNRVFLKDGTTEWFPSFHSRNKTYGTHPDILWLSLGQWMSDKIDGLCDFIEDVFEMFVIHPAKIKIWVNIPKVRTSTVNLARAYRDCEQQLSFPPNIFYFDLYNYTSHFENIFWGDGYHLVEDHQHVMMLNALDIICSAGK
mmetsp:Transcript_22568/g.64934  ORF Transcript_22568/g.64934 Transcript_22568/m.64934 type:complete len:367 (-) Transcript_22568:47-1147(-)